MRLTGLRSVLVLAFAVSTAGGFAGCDNPFDPLNTTSEIKGLTYFDFTAAQSHWDSDPEWDGLQLTMAYYNEFGDTLTFHDKAHKVRIDFYSQGPAEPPSTQFVRGSLLTSKTVNVVNSDDLINIPIESYGGALPLPSTVSIKGCLELHVFPPKASPQPELVSLQCDIEFYTPEAALASPP